MKIIEVNVGTTKIEFHHSMWTRQQYIYVNDKLVSKKFAWFGVKHRFSVKEQGELVDYVLSSGLGWTRIKTTLIRNGVVMLKTGGSSCTTMTIPELAGRSILKNEYV